MATPTRAVVEIPATAPPLASLSIHLRPVAEPTPSVHVAIDATAPGSNDATWRLPVGSPDRVRSVRAHDASGDLRVEVLSTGAALAVDLSFHRTPTGPVHVEYDILATDTAKMDPLEVLVQGDRFRGAGERLIALPASVRQTRLSVTVEIDPGPLQAEKVASSLGVGTTRHTEMRPQALWYAGFMAGSSGDVVIDAPEGHDEASWLGYPTFDARVAAVELAQVRTAFAELFGARDTLPGPPWTYLFDVSGARPTGAFEVTPRLNGLLLQVGSHEPWAAPLQLSLTQVLARRWIGDALRFVVPPGHEAELGWFNDGVARYIARRLLAKLGALTSKQWAEQIAEDLSTLATSPYAAQDIATVAARVADDPRARIALMMRGSLYATREAAVIRARSKGAENIESALVSLLVEARVAHDVTTRALPVSAWLDTLTKDDPDAATVFDASVLRGGPITLPADALGPCFRAGMGEYVALDLGFDLAATRAAADRKIVGLRDGGPAAKAGLERDDVLESIDERGPSSPAKLVVSRAGKTVNLSYWPRGARGRGQIWTRTVGIAEDRCGLPP